MGSEWKWLRMISSFGPSISNVEPSDFYVIELVSSEWQLISIVVLLIKYIALFLIL